MKLFDLIARNCFRHRQYGFDAACRRAHRSTLPSRWDTHSGFRNSAVGGALLEAVGYTVIAIAVFDVGKYLLEEEAIRGREMRKADEARRSMTKFMSTIAIAVFLELLVAVFAASKDNISDMIYPTLLLLSGVALVVGLGVYQRLSVEVEQDEGPDPQTENVTASRKRKSPSSGSKR